MHDPRREIHIVVMNNPFFFWYMHAPYVQVEFWICLILSLFAYLPGIIYAVWVIIKKDD